MPEANTHPSSGIKFTPEQARFLEHDEGRSCRILAGPGTGKSTVAVEYLRRKLASNPEFQFRFLTFTRAATAELTEKLTLISDEMEVKASTVHSFAISIVLRNEGCVSIPLPLRLPDDWEESTIIETDLAKLLGCHKRLVGDLIKEMAAKWESLEESQNQRIPAELRAKFMGIWMAHRKRLGYTLLQELPDLLRLALRDNEELDGIGFHLLLVDEYQDLNACDLEVVRAIAERGITVIAIGDDDQSIYSFRKAHPAGIRRFHADYLESDDYSLTVCKRCAPNILEWANFVIAGASTRAERPLLQASSDKHDGVAKLLRFNNDAQEAKQVAILVQKLIGKGVSPSQILIMSRTDTNGAFSRPIRTELDRLGIASTNPDETKKLLGTEDVRRIIALLRLYSNIEDSLAWRTLVELKTGIGRVAIDAIYNLAEDRDTTFGSIAHSLTEPLITDLGPAMRRKLLELIESTKSTVSRLHDRDQELEDRSPGLWIQEMFASDLLPAPPAEFDACLQEINLMPKTFESVDSYVSSIWPLALDIAKAKSDKVRLMTLSGSKGLTVQAAILVGAENQLIPSPRGETEEERRILYVGMTRATDFLFLTWVNQRRGPAGRAGRATQGLRQPSDFLRGGPVESELGVRFVTDF